MFLKRCLLLLIILLTAAEAGSQTMTLVTYNIRLDNSGDGPNSWPLRKTLLCNQIKTSGADIFGIQEGLPQQVDFIDSSFTRFRHLGVGRDDGIRQGEFSAIYYNTQKFKVLQQSTFWLSATPDKPSLGWDAACRRVCTYGLFESILSGRKFWVFNTHFDHVGVVARKNSAVLILHKINEFNKEGLPVILMGDFNCGPDSEPIVFLSGHLYDSKLRAKNVSDGTGGTFNGFDPSLPVTERIDYIFTNLKELSVKGYTVLKESHDGLYPSDHYPVVVELKFDPLKKP